MSSLRKKDKTRYALMSPSKCLDEFTGEAYPDILSIPFNDFTFTSLPRKITLHMQYVDKPYNLHKDIYGTYEGDDVLLELNLVPHPEYLHAGMTLYCPSSDDMTRFHTGGTVAARKRKTL